MAWKNGGGITRELAVSPANAPLDQFIWRASLAEVSRDGAFSRFDGIDRSLVLLDGAGMSLQFDDGATHTLHQPYQTLHFAGERAIEARLHAGPTRDFNLMVRRDAAQGTLEIAQGAAHLNFDARVALLYCARGTVELACRQRAAGQLQAGDALLIEPAEAGLWNADLHADTVLLAIRITLLNRPGTIL